MNRMTELVQENLTKAQKEQKRYYDKNYPTIKQQAISTVIEKLYDWMDGGKGELRDGYVRQEET